MRPKSARSSSPSSPAPATAAHIRAALQAWQEAPTRGGPPVLAIESSCDETAAAVLTGTRELRAHVVHSQIATHAPYGGVVPELASRAHIEAIAPVVDEALVAAGISAGHLAGVVVTRGPGLTGSLLVGLEFAKGLAQVRGIPLVGIHHLEGHLMAPWLGVADGFDEPMWPCVALLVSGGHTSLYSASAPGVYRELGRTIDDAAGEAFDKLSKMLGLGYPGGAIIDRLADRGDPRRFALPRPLGKQAGLDFSFSGLKTAASHVLRGLGDPSERDVLDLAASFREAVAEILTQRTLRAVQQTRAPCVVLSGGVASNRRLRELLREATSTAGVRLSVPPGPLCTDNAAMIGAAGYARLWHVRHTSFTSHRLDATASWSLGDVLSSGPLSCDSVAVHERTSPRPPGT